MNTTEKALASTGILTRAENPAFTRAADSMLIVPQNSRFITADEIAADLHRSKRFAYRLIRQLNQELEERGKFTARGRVLRAYYLQRTGIGDAE